MTCLTPVVARVLDQLRQQPAHHRTCSIRYSTCSSSAARRHPLHRHVLRQRVPALSCTKESAERPGRSRKTPRTSYNTPVCRQRIGSHRTSTGRRACAHGWLICLDHVQGGLDRQVLSTKIHPLRNPYDVEQSYWHQRDDLLFAYYLFECGPLGFQRGSLRDGHLRNREDDIVRGLHLLRDGFSWAPQVPHLDWACPGKQS
jgi:hypothetical protein